MTGTVRRSSFVVAAALVVVLLAPARAQQDFAARAPAAVTFLQLNDVYTALPTDGQAAWRVATLETSSRAPGTRRSSSWPAISSPPRSPRACSRART
jgi:hypothetical protein